MMTTRLHSENGFTLIELLVAMTAGLVVLFAMLGSFDAFSRGVDSTSRLVDAEDSVRRDVGQVVRILREAGVPAASGAEQPATLVSDVGPTDIVFRSTSWPVAGHSQAGPYVQRLCVDEGDAEVAGDGILWFEGAPAASAGGIVSGAACPSGAGTSLQMADGVVNVADSGADLPLFRDVGDSATEDEPVQSIGLTLRLEGGRVGSSRPLFLWSGVTPRGSVPTALDEDDFDDGPDCETGDALLTLNAAPGFTISTDYQGAIQVGPAKLLLEGSAAASLTEVTVEVRDPRGLLTVLNVPIDLSGPCVS